MSTSMSIDELVFLMTEARERGVNRVIVYHEHEGQQEIQGAQVSGSDDGDVFMIHTDAFGH